METSSLRLRRKSHALLCLLILIGCLHLACTGSKQSAQRVTETSSTPTQTAPAPTATPVQPAPAESPEPVPPPPKPEEVREVVARVYKDAVAVETGHQPAYLVGDFNGDDSQDIAVFVRPTKGKLEEINSEYANWITEDPRQVALPDPQKSVQQLPASAAPVKVKASDLLLTIIHGYKKEGWRNHEAQQTYLLSNAVGSSMTIVPVKDLEKGERTGLMKSGDAIREKLAGEQGLLYWTGAKYAWHKKQ